MVAAGAQGTGWRIAALAGAWVAGVALQLQQGALWPLAVYQGGVACALLMLVAAWRLPALRHTLGLAVALALLAAASTGWRAEQQLAQRLPHALEGRDLVVTGVVASLPQSGASGLRFVAEVEQAWLDGRPVRLPERLALGWYNGFGDEVALDDPRANLRAGQRWRWPLRLKRPHGSANPGGFDAELW
ncbi:MAG: competence protein ComEC, partial [Burkholderiales bacterium PBB5]